jgi:DNA-binding transcriptional LysR family regulator
MEQMVRQSEIELAVTTTHSDSPSLIYERCRQEELVFLACPTHRLTKRQPTMAELAQASLIVFEEGNVEGVASILKKLEQRGLRLNIVMRCESAEAVKNAVKAGAGIGLLYRDAVRSEIDRGELKVIRFPGIEMCTESFIIYHGERALSADAKDFLALLHKSRTVLQAEQSPKHLAVAVQYKLSRLSLRSRGEYRFTDGKATSS